MKRICLLVVPLAVLLTIAASADAQSRLPRAAHQARPLQTFPLSRHSTMADSTSILQKTYKHSTQKTPTVQKHAWQKDEPVQKAYQKGCGVCQKTCDPCACCGPRWINPLPAIHDFLNRLLPCHQCGVRKCGETSKGCGVAQKSDCGCGKSAVNDVPYYSPFSPYEPSDEDINPFEDDDLLVPPVPQMRSTSRERSSGRPTLAVPAISPGGNHTAIGTGIKGDLRIKPVQLINFESPVR